MFGAIVAGRLVQTNLQQIDETHFLFPLEAPQTINHLTVFLTSTPFPDGYGASVHFQWPGKDYLLIGVLTNAKPSTICRVRPHIPPTEASSSQIPPANLGIEIAPLAQIESMARQLALSPAHADAKGREVAGRVDVGRVAEKVVRNLFNYLHSFGGDAKLTPDTPIPLSVFHQWYNGFSRKIETDRGAAFLDREE